MLSPSHGWPSWRSAPGCSHSPTTPRTFVPLGECERFCACGIGKSDERTCSAIVLSLCLTGFAMASIQDEAMDDDSCMPLMMLSIPLNLPSMGTCLPAVLGSVLRYGLYLSSKHRVPLACYVKRFVKENVHRGRTC